MSEFTGLERRYRRLIACYPAAYRREHESEICEVLLTVARDGQRFPSVAETTALLRSALGMRVARADRRPPRTVNRAVRLMLLGAIVELAVLAVVALTQGSLHATILRHDPAYSAAQWHAERLGHILPIEIGAPIVAMLWLALAWATARGRSWGRVGALMLCTITTVSLLAGLAAGAVTYSPADAIAGAVLWGVTLAAVVSAFGRGSGAFFTRRST